MITDIIMIEGGKYIYIYIYICDFRSYIYVIMIKY